MSTQRTAVLVHGAFADASGYAGVIRLLQAQGISVRAPMNPLRGLASDAEAIRRYTTTIDGPIVLVGHSYGGAVISQAAPSVSDVRALVFLSAFALDESESCASVMEPFYPSMLASTNVPSPYDAPGAVGGPDLFIKIDQFHETFCGDLSDDVAGPMAVSQRPLAASAFTEQPSAVGWRDLPCWYLVSEHDNAIPPDCERFMAQRMNAVTESVDGSHVAFIAQPEVASNLILKAFVSV
ncbi:MAG TPA: alpha/beta hydrolase [Acidimicrobiales bacterium]|nr:alpha/beta hydrolase [Acidimicrobiales bacterium]